MGRYPRPPVGMLIRLEGIVRRMSLDQLLEQLGDSPFRHEGEFWCPLCQRDERSRIRSSPSARFFGGGVCFECSVCARSMTWWSMVDQLLGDPDYIQRAMESLDDPR